MKYMIPLLLLISSAHAGTPLDALIYVYIKDCKMVNMKSEFPLSQGNPPMAMAAALTMREWRQTKWMPGEPMQDQYSEFLENRGYVNQRTIEINVDIEDCRRIDYMPPDPYADTNGKKNA